MQTTPRFVEAFTNEINPRAVIGPLAILVLLLHLLLVTFLLHPVDDDEVKPPKVVEVVLLKEQKPEIKPEIKPTPAPPAPAKPLPPKKVLAKKKEIKPHVTKKEPIIPKKADRHTPQPKAELPVLTRPSFSSSTSKPALPASSSSVNSKSTASKSGNGAAKGKGVSSGVVELGCPKAKYPMRAQSRRIEGWVKIEMTVSPDGRVTNARVVGSEPAGMFDDAALTAFRNCRFKPKMVNGKAVTVSTVKKATFKTIR